MIELLVVVIVGMYSYVLGYKRAVRETEEKLRAALWHASKQLSPEAFRELSNILKKGAKS